MNVVKVILPDSKEVELPLLRGTSGPDVVDVSKLYEKTGLFTYDPGFQSTASCKSEITFVDGDKGELRYRGYDITALMAEPYLGVAYLLLHGELANAATLAVFEDEVRYHSMVHEQLTKVLLGFPRKSHPMAVLVGCTASLSAFYHDAFDIYDSNNRFKIAAMIIAKMPTLVAMIYKHAIGQPMIYPDNSLDYASNFLRMMFAVPTEKYVVNPIFSDALSKILLLHADHEQNASTSTVRMCGSSGANPFACVGSGVASLWGPSHGGANEAVVKQLHEIGDKKKVAEFVRRSKDPNDGFRLMGVGHRIYKNFDPRAKVLKEICASVIDKSNAKHSKEMLEVAVELERVVLHDEYFVSRKLYPNVDFYSGIILTAMGVPTNMFTLIFALGRVIGWISQWSEMFTDGHSLKIGRPRQLYTGHTLREYEPLSKRK